jgi:hypothetical protein
MDAAADIISDIRNCLNKAGIRHPDAVNHYPNSDCVIEWYNERIAVCVMPLTARQAVYDAGIYDSCDNYRGHRCDTLAQAIGNLIVWFNKY